MDQTRPPPPITITDPADCREPVDLLDAGEPRRLSSEQRTWGRLAAAIVVLLGTGLYGASAIRTDRRLDTAALHHVALSSISTGRASSGALQLAFANLGPDPVSVVSARVLAAGYRPLPAEPNQLGPGRPDVVTFRAGSCQRGAVEDYGAAVDVQVRTARGGLRTLRFRGLVDGAFVAGFVAGVQRRCGLFPPAASLQVAGVLSAVTGRDLRLGLVITNVAKDPRTLQSLAIDDGLALARPFRPLGVAGKASGVVEVLVRVRDCALAKSAWVRASGTGSLDAQVVGDSRTETAPALLRAGADSIGAWLLQVCR